MGQLSHLRLRHFRNYQALDLELTNGLSAFVGCNGQGKTNLLEAIHYLSLLRSFRTRRASDLRQWDAPFFFTEGLVEGRDSALERHRLTVTYTSTRRLRIDGKIVAKASAFINKLICVAFVPEDIALVKGGPGIRRRFADVLLCQLDSVYLSHLMRYSLALKSRNAMLRDSGQFKGNAIRAYDSVLAVSGSYLINARRQVCRDLNRELEALSDSLFGSGTTVRLRYAASLTPPNGEANNHEAFIRETLAAESKRDQDQGYTRLGPHRDDLQIVLNKRSAGTYGSEGQCRLISLALRLASVDILALSKKGRNLILLVDDVLGELDRERRGRFLQTFMRADQTFLACTELPDNLSQEPAAIFRIEDGKLTV